jgi:anaerobic selenocysteine-containing dehydrogenase
LTRLPEVIGSGQESPIQALFVANSNPMHSLPDSQAVAKAIEKIPYVVSFSSVMDETAAGADLILPNHLYLERYEDVAAASGFPKPIIGLVQPVVEPLFNTRHTGDVMIQIARAMGRHISGAFPWESYEACLEETLGDVWDTLTEQGYWLDEEFAAPGWDQMFETDSSRFEFVNAEIDGLPGYNPVKPEGDETHYPLVLIPYDSMRLNTGDMASPPFLVKAVDDTILLGNDVLVEVNPATAKELGLKKGGLAKLATPKGEARVRVYLSEGIMPGVVGLVRGLGHTAFDSYLAGKGVNYNALSVAVIDVATGHNAAWGIRARLSRA